MKMKTLLTILTLLTITYSVSAQSSYDDLIKQSRRARTTSTIFVVAGPVVAAGGIGTLLYGVFATALEEPGYYYDANNNYVETPAKKHTTEMIIGGAGTLAGIALALTSIHFSNKADDLKREARKAKLKTSTDRISIPGLQNGYANSRTRQFKVSLMIPLGR
jgi:hypothetical protein